VRLAAAWSGARDVRPSHGRGLAGVPTSAADTTRATRECRAHVFHAADIIGAACARRDDDLLRIDVLMTGAWVDAPPAIAAADCERTPSSTTRRALGSTAPRSSAERRRSTPIRQAIRAAASGPACGSSNPVSLSTRASHSLSAMARDRSPTRSPAPPSRRGRDRSPATRRTNASG
jgi:hypothetical protein